MMDTKFEAKLQIQPLLIVNLSFSRSIFEFRHREILQDSDLPLFLGDIYPDGFAFGSEINFYEEKGEQCLEVLASVKAQDESKLCNFHVDCIGKYVWKGEELNEKLKKSVVAWALSVQVSAIREHVARETSNGPFKTAYYLPVALVGVTENTILSHSE